MQLHCEKDIPYYCLHSDIQQMFLVQLVLNAIFTELTFLSKRCLKCNRNKQQFVLLQFRASAVPHFPFWKYIFDTKLHCNLRTTDHRAEEFLLFFTSTSPKSFGYFSAPELMCVYTAYSLKYLILWMFLEWPLSLFASWGLVLGWVWICFAESSVLISLYCPPGQGRQ